jgi:hypothetical protein
MRGRYRNSHTEVTSDSAPVPSASRATRVPDRADFLGF